MSRESGFKGEQIALHYLLDQGYTQLTQNFFSRQGELDLVVLDPKDTLVVIEVKAYKPNSLVHPLQAITPKKLHHIHKALLYFWKKHPQYASHSCRVDVMVVRNNRVEQHVENVLQVSE